MSKELEELKSSISNWYGELKRSIGIDNINLIKKLIDEQALTPPTEEEVCEELTKFFGKDIEYYRIGKLGIFCFKKNDNIKDIMTHYTKMIGTDLLQMIGRFYGGLK